MAVVSNKDKYRAMDKPLKGLTNTASNQKKCVHKKIVHDATRDWCTREEHQCTPVGICKADKPKNLVNPLLLVPPNLRHLFRVFKNTLLNE